MQHRILWPIIGGASLILVLLGLSLAFTGNLELALGLIGPLALGLGFMAVILYGHRSRRDEAVHRAIPDDDFD